MVQQKYIKLGVAGLALVAMILGVAIGVSKNKDKSASSAASSKAGDFEAMAAYDDKLECYSAKSGKGSSTKSGKGSSTKSGKGSEGPGMSMPTRRLVAPGTEEYVAQFEFGEEKWRKLRTEIMRKLGTETMSMETGYKSGKSDKGSKSNKGSKSDKGSSKGSKSCPTPSDICGSTGKSGKSGSGKSGKSGSGKSGKSGEGSYCGKVGKSGGSKSSKGDDDGEEEDCFTPSPGPTICNEPSPVPTPSTTFDCECNDDKRKFVYTPGPGTVWQCLQLMCEQECDDINEDDCMVFESQLECCVSKFFDRFCIFEDLCPREPTPPVPPTPKEEIPEPPTPFPVAEVPEPPKPSQEAPEPTPAPSSGSTPTVSTAASGPPTKAGRPY